MDIAESIVKDTRRAQKNLDTARAALIEALASSQTLRSELVDDVQKAEARYEVWAFITRAFEIESRKVGATAEIAARTAVAKGRERCLGKLVAGPNGSSSPTHRALSEVALEGVRSAFYSLEGYEN
ncbi:hypothetical protein ACIRPQ_29360 [Streptomyces sp. NPDC101213]|uniref:hypothetical protein n=1 Tax=Streptomyces sp. NPDC101213 TaxID=3366130 RepID=UPI0038056C35